MTSTSLIIASLRGQLFASEVSDSGTGDVDHCLRLDEDRLGRALVVAPRDALSQHDERLKWSLRGF